MNRNGWIYFDQLIDLELIDSINKELPDIAEIRRQVQIKNGITERTEGTVHHMLELNSSSFEFIARMYLSDYIKEFLDGNFIINSYGGLYNIKNKLSYTGNVHRDVRSWTGDYKIMINMLVMLDDFTLDNGATWLYTGSHHCSEKPTDQEFFEKADRGIGKKGSIILFDSMLWHATGENKTDSMRRALTLTLTRPFLKQQFDYPRYIGYDKTEKLPDDLLQILGYNSRVPSTLDEWYQPPNKRMYKKDQG
jgi:hypothetical protein